MSNKYWKIKTPTMNLPDIRAKTESEVREKLRKKYRKDFISNGVTIRISPEQMFIDKLFKNYEVTDIDISGGSFVRHAKVNVVNDKRKFGEDIYIVTYEASPKVYGSLEKEYNIKSILKVKNPLNRYSYQINGQPSTNTTYAKLK